VDAPGPEEPDTVAAPQVEAGPSADDVPESEPAPDTGAAPERASLADASETDRRRPTHWSLPREGATTVSAAGWAERGRRQVKDALDRETVIAVARRVNRNATAGMTDEQVLSWLLDVKGRRDSLAGTSSSASTRAI
jgi:hypothetical protein